MIELSAILGAMILTHADLVANGHKASDGETIRLFLYGPVVGAIWGAAVGTIIHFIANGYLLNIAIGLVSLLLDFI